MVNTNPALHPALYLAIGVLSGRALFHNWLKDTHPRFQSDRTACLKGYFSFKKKRIDKKICFRYS